MRWKTEKMRKSENHFWRVHYSYKKEFQKENGGARRRKLSQK